MPTITTNGHPIDHAEAGPEEPLLPSHGFLRCAA